MSKFSPAEDANDGTSEPNRAAESDFAPKSASPPQSIATNIGDAVATRPTTPESVATPGLMPEGENASYSPYPQAPDSGQTYPHYPAAAPRAPIGVPPANPPLPAAYPSSPQVPASVPGSQFPPSYPVYPVSQPLPSAYPVAPTPGGALPQPIGLPPKNRKSYRVPIVVLSVILVLALCALGTVLYKVLSRDDSLAVGVKPAWEKPAKVKLAAKGEPGFAYTLYSAEKDQLFLLQPFKDGSGIAQMLDPETGAKTGKSITLPKCDNSLKYPYQIKGGKIICATRDVIKANTNKKYQFKEEIFISTYLVVGASPSATNATQIVAYSPKTTKLLWVQNLEKPASVTCNGKAVYTTRVVDDSSSEPTPDSGTSTENPKPEGTQASGEEESQELEVMALSGSSQAQDSPKEDLSPAAAQPSEPEVAKDAIKNIDFANAYQPLVGSPECAEANFWQKADGTPIARKMPATTSECWATMKNGTSVEQFTPAPMNPESHLDAIKLTGNEVDEAFDAASFKPDPSKSYAVGYGDVNADGYLDALLVVDVFEGNGFNLAIFDPADPEHPYLTAIGPALVNGAVKIVAPGRINIYGSDPVLGSGSPDLIAEMSIKGFEISDYIDHYSSL